MRVQPTMGGKAGAILRRPYLLAGCALAGAIVAVVVAFFLPRHYEASCELRVLDNGKLHALYGRRLAGASGGEGLAERAASEATLFRVANRLGLEGQAGALAENTEVDVDSGIPTSPVLTIRHRSERPERAWSVVTAIATELQEEHCGPTQGAAEREFRDLRRLGEETRVRAEAAASELAAFERENARHRLGGADDTRARLEEERSSLAGVEGEIDSLEGQLANVRAQLADEPQYLEEEAQEGEDAPRRKNPVYAELRKSELEVLSALTVKRKLKEDYAGRVETLETRMAEFPVLERRWKELKAAAEEREGEARELRSRESSAREALAARTARETVVMEILEPPSYPTTPIKPFGGFLWVAGLLGGLAVGVVASMVGASLDRSFHGPREVAACTDVPVLGAIPRIETLGERMVAERKRRLAALAVLLLLLAAGAGVFLHLNYDAQVSSLVGDAVRSVR